MLSEQIDLTTLDVLGPPDVVVCGLRGYVMTPVRAERFADGLAALAREVFPNALPEHMSQTHSQLREHRQYGKFTHSLFLVDEDDVPVAMIAGEECPPGRVTEVPALVVFVLTVHPSLRRRGVARELARVAYERSTALGFTELPVAPGTPLTIVAHVTEDRPDREALVDFYGEFGLRPRDVIEAYGESMHRLEAAL